MIPSSSSLTSKQPLVEVLQLGGSVSATTRDPEFVAVILAGRAGARLFPLTSDVEQRQHLPEDQQEGKPRSKLKHLLPLGGEPVLVRLLQTIQCSGDINRVIVAVSQQDVGTLQALMEHYKGRTATVSTNPICHTSISFANSSSTSSNLGILTTVTIAGQHSTTGTKSSFLKQQPFSISIVHLKSSHCAGSADALRYLASLSIKVNHDLNTKKLLLPKNSNVILMTADTILEGKGILGLLAEAHRRGTVIGSGSYSPTTTTTSFAVSSLTMLLSDVGEEDENGIPLKESAKQKKGSLSRNEEDVEYIALSTYPKSQSSMVAASAGPTIVLPSERVLFKRGKIDVEDDLNKTGQTPKLILSKSTLRNAASQKIHVRTDLDDIHLYAISPWVIQLIQTRTELSSIQKEVIPLLTSRQFKGVQSAFGSNIHKLSKEKVDALKTCLPTLLQTTKSFSIGRTDYTSSSSSPTTISSNIVLNPNNKLLEVDEHEHDDTFYYDEEDTAYMVGGGTGDEGGDIRRFHPLLYHVAAVVLPRGQRLVLRACTINHYLYACRELVAHALKAPTKEELLLLPNATSISSSPPLLSSYYNNSTYPCSPAAEEALYDAMGSTFTPLQGTISSKFSTLILPDATIGEKATLKSCTVGRFCKIGNKCRLNNVVIMDHAKIGDNCVLQNSIIGEYVVVGDNCNFNDVQVGPGAVVRSGTKCKNESISGGEKTSTALDGHSDDDSFSDNP